MISLTQLCPRTFFCAAVIAATTVASSAQRIQLPPFIDVDCAAYRRQDDGTWTVLHSNKVVLGNNVNRDVLAGDDPQTIRLTDRSSFDRVLSALCGRLSR